MSIFVLLLILTILVIIGYFANQGYHRNVVLQEYDNSSRMTSLCLYGLCVLFVIAFVCYIHFTSIYTRPSVWASTFVLMMLFGFLCYRILKLLKR